jgi:hypothetical protein
MMCCCFVSLLALYNVVILIRQDLVDLKLKAYKREKQEKTASLMMEMF